MSNRKDLVKLILVILIGIAVIGFLGYSSFNKFKTISSLEKVIEEKNTKLEAAENKLDMLIKLKQNRRLYAEKKESFEKVIPTTPQEKEVYEFVKEIADKYNVVIEGMGFQDKINREHYVEIPINLQIAGSYNGVIHVLDELQYGERMINVMEVGIARGEAGNIQVKARLETFFRPAS